MTDEQIAIHEAFDELYIRLLATRDKFLAESLVKTEDYAGITKNDALVWFIEDL